MGDRPELTMTTNPPIGGFTRWPSAQGCAISRTHPGGSAPAHRYANLLIGDHLNKFRPWADLRQQSPMCKFACRVEPRAPLAADDRRNHALPESLTQEIRPWADFRQQTQRCKFASLRHAIAPGLTADHTEIMPIGKISLLVAHATDLR